MRIAIFSDIHGNSTALDAVIEDARSQNINHFACLGDVVGYGPDPSGCIARLQELNCICVKGNHDEDASNERDLSNLVTEAKESLEWTRGVISDSQKEWLRDLPYQRRLGRNLLVHSSEKNSEKWQYLRNNFDAKIALSSQNAHVCFFGHTHVPAVYSDEAALYEEDELLWNQLDPKRKYLVNVGSVGQPRDSNSQACYTIFDRSAGLLMFRRVEYNIEYVVQEIEQANLSEVLAKRLREAV